MGTIRHTLHACTLTCNFGPTETVFRTMLFFSYLSVLMTLSGAINEPHAIYISVVELESDEIRVKVFSDDLRDAIRNHTGVQSVSIDDFCAKYQKEIQQYFGEKLRLKINEAEVPYQYKIATEEGDSYWITFSFIKSGDWKSVKVEDTHFMELFPTQSNIIKVGWPDLRFGKIRAGETSCSFEF